MFKACIRCTLVRLLVLSTHLRLLFTFQPSVPMKHVEVASCSIAEDTMTLLHHLSPDVAYASILAAAMLGVNTTCM